MTIFAPPFAKKIACGAPKNASSPFLTLTLVASQRCAATRIGYPTSAPPRRWHRGLGGALTPLAYTDPLLMTINNNNA